MALGPRPNQDTALDTLGPGSVDSCNGYRRLSVDGITTCCCTPHHHSFTQ